MIAGFPAMSAQRLLVFGGVALIAAGMIFGDIFAVFVLHQNGGKTGEALLAATKAVTAQNPAEVKELFSRIGGLLEDRGTKVDTHVHMTDAGYLALLLALVQPYVALSAIRKKSLAKLFLLGGILLPVGIFLIHYVGLDDGILDCVLEIKGSYKIGKYIPGTLIPVLEESRLLEDQPEYALLLSWHIAEELIPKLVSKGFRGKFLVPLPVPRVIDAAGKGY